MSYVSGTCFSMFCLGHQELKQNYPTTLTGSSHLVYTYLYIYIYIMISLAQVEGSEGPMGHRGGAFEAKLHGDGYVEKTTSDATEHDASQQNARSLETTITKSTTT